MFTRNCRGFSLSIEHVRTKNKIDVVLDPGSMNSGICILGDTASAL